MEQLIDFLIVTIIPKYLFLAGVFLEFIARRSRSSFWLKFSPLMALILYGLFLGPFMPPSVHLVTLVVFSVSFLVLNYKNVGIVIYCMGSLMNRVAMFANGYKMPASTQLVETKFLKPLTDGTSLPILCDWIKTPGSLVISIGDIIIDIGCLVFFCFALREVILKYKQKR